MLNANKKITNPKINPNNFSEAMSSKSATMNSNMLIPPYFANKLIFTILGTIITYINKKVNKDSGY